MLEEVKRTYHGDFSYLPRVEDGNRLCLSLVEAGITCHPGGCPEKKFFLAGQTS